MVSLLFSQMLPEPSPRHGEALLQTACPRSEVASPHSGHLQGIWWVKDVTLNHSRWLRCCSV